MSDTDERDEAAEDFDPESRRLCPDDTCVGVIGPDGRCKECGAESPDGPPPTSAAAADAGDADAGDADAGDADGGDADGTEAAPVKKPALRVVATPRGDSSDFDPDERTLCSDDTCTGLIGPDGTCKECGKAYDG